MLVTFRDYGATLDEGVQNRYGRRLVRAYATLGQDRSATSQNDLYFYGGLFELLVQAVEPWSGLGVYESRHLTTALVAFLGLVAVWGLARRIGGALVGFLALLLLTLTPSYYGHAFANPKDIPFASLYALACWCVVRASDELSARRVAAAGAAIGLAAAVRVAGITLVPFAGLLWLASRWRRARDGSRRPAAPARRELARLGLALLVVLVVAWMLMIAFWPWALLDPLRHPLQAFGKFAHFWNTDVLWKGRLTPAEELPRSYLPQVLALKLPELYPAALLLGVTGLVAARGRGAGRLPPEKHVQAAWLGLLVAAPILWAVLLKTPLYHGCRHVLFVLPLLAALAALGVAAFLRSPLPRVVHAGGLALLAGLALVTAADMIELHPYQYVYFNRLFAGGLRRAADRYETDYYVASCREAIDWIVDHYPQGEPGRRVRVAAPLTGFPVFYYLDQSEARRRRFEAVVMGQAPRLVLASTSYREQDRVAGRRVHVVERQGAPLLYVIELPPPR